MTTGAIRAHDASMRRMLEVAHYLKENEARDLPRVTALELLDDCLATTKRLVELEREVALDAPPARRIFTLDSGETNALTVAMDEGYFALGTSVSLEYTEPDARDLAVLLLVCRRAATTEEHITAIRSLFIAIERMDEGVMLQNSRPVQPSPEMYCTDEVLRHQTDKATSPEHLRALAREWRRRGEMQLGEDCMARACTAALAAIQGAGDEQLAYCPLAPTLAHAHAPSANAKMSGDTVYCMHCHRPITETPVYNSVRWVEVVR